MYKLILLLLIVPIVSFGQYSNYYNVDVNSYSDVNVSGAVDVNVNKNVSGNVNVNKTVTSIDYGALRLANAQREKNRLEAQAYGDEKTRREALEIAMNPFKAFDYGKDNSWEMDKENSESRGFKKGAVWYHKVPHKSLFTSTGGGYNYRNTSEDGIVVEIELGDIIFMYGTTSLLKSSKINQQKYINDSKKFLGDTEKYVKMMISDLQVGKLKDDKYFTHKVEINKAKVYGQDGFVWTWVYEDDYEYVIKDNFSLILGNGIKIDAGVRYRGDKDKIDFELLEGRRAYLKRLCDHIIATANLIPSKKGFNKSIL